MMKKIVFLMVSVLFFVSCSIVPYHKTGYVVTKENQKIVLTGGHVIVDSHELHFVDKTADFTLMKKEIKELHLNY